MPTLQSPTLVPWTGGYAVGGVHCASMRGMGEQSVCEGGTAVVSFLNPDGTTEAVVEASGVTDANPDMVRIVPGEDSVFARVGQDAWYAVTPSGFDELPGRAGPGEVCRLDDGSTVVATIDMIPGDTENDSDVASLQFATLTDGRWTDLGGPIKAVNSPGHNPLVTCVPGGFVTTLGYLTSADGLRPSIANAKGSDAAVEAVASAAGFDPSGRLFLSRPDSENAPPQILGEGSPVTFAASDRWVGLSADGKLVATGSSPSDVRIVATT